MHCLFADSEEPTKDMHKVELLYKIFQCKKILFPFVFIVSCILYKNDFDQEYYFLDCLP